MIAPHIQFQCQVEQETSQQEITILYLSLLKNSLALSKPEQPTKILKTFDLESDWTRIAWNYQNGTLKGIIINYLSTNKQKTKQIHFSGYTECLSRLKQLLDGRVFYFQFSSQFEIQKTLAKKNISEIVQCINKQNGEIKIAKKIYMNNIFQDKISQEVEVMMKLKGYPHKYLLCADEIYKEEDQLIYVMDYCAGGTLFNYFANHNFQITMEQMKKIMKKILKGVHHLHQLHIMHRDLKFDNIMLRYADDINSIKIIDFGLSTHCETQQIAKCGTPGYIAPEILNDQPYNQLCDIYSLGCLFHSLISGEKLFPPNVNKTQLVQLNKENKYKLSKNIADPYAIDLLKKMLQPNRPSALECLEHPYFQKNSHMKYSLEQRIKQMHFPLLKNPFKQICA